MTDETPRVDDPKDVIDGATVVKTGDQTRFTADVSPDGDLRLFDGYGTVKKPTASQLLDLLKRGEYYVPDTSSDFQDALRELGGDD